jgi:hypothetical protein
MLKNRYQHLLVILCSLLLLVGCSNIKVSSGNVLVQPEGKIEQLTIDLSNISDFALGDSWKDFMNDLRSEGPAVMKQYGLDAVVYTIRGESSADGRARKNVYTFQIPRTTKSFTSQVGNIYGFDLYLYDPNGVVVYRTHSGFASATTRYGKETAVSFFTNLGARLSQAGFLNEVQGERPPAMILPSNAAKGLSQLTDAQKEAFKKWGWQIPSSICCC